MSKKKSQAFRGVRKAAHISRKAFSKAANLSGRVEKKADRIIHGTDPIIQIHDKVLFEKIYAEAIPEIIPIHPALPLPGSLGTITLFIPSLQRSSFFGGTATALIFAAKMAEKKSMHIRIVETLVHGQAKSEDLSAFLNSNGFKIKTDEIKIVNLAGRKYNHYGYIEIHPDDVYIASAWWDAYLLERLPLLSKFIYLIQDYEPIFYNNSDHFILSESTYHSDKYIPVCNTKLMYDFMCGKGYANIAKSGVYFEPAIGVREKYGLSLEKKAGQKKRIFVYGRPAVHRNLFYNALESINQAFSTYQLDGNEWEIYMAGQDGVADILLDAGLTAKNLGKMPIEQYYEFARTIDVAVSLMLAPHPSYPPLELASLGATVVTTKYQNKADLQKYSKNIIITDADQAKITECIVKAANVSYNQRIRNTKNDTITNDWHKALKEVVDKVSKLT
jgi:hypothetical protein